MELMPTFYCDPMKHKHQAVERIERPFSGPVESERPNLRAHGWVTVEQVCRCGAVRFVNVNQKEIEAGHWCEKGEA